MFKKIFILFFCIASLFSTQRAYSATAIEYALLQAQGLNYTSTTANQGTNPTFVSQQPITWLITFNSSTNLYNYAYVFPVSDTNPALPWTFNGNLAIQTNATDQVTGVRGATLVGAGTFSNPAVSGAIQGLEFSVSGIVNGGSINMDFNSPYAPVWGSILISGTTRNGTVAETNLSYLQPGGSDVAVSTDFILVPGIAVPEPSMYMIMSVPLAFIAFYKGQKKALEPVVR